MRRSSSRDANKAHSFISVPHLAVLLLFDASYVEYVVASYQDFAQIAGAVTVDVLFGVGQLLVDRRVGREAG